MKKVRDKSVNVVIGIIVIFIINSITIFMNSSNIINFIVNLMPEGINIIAMGPSEVLLMSINISVLISFILVVPIIIYYFFNYISDAMYTNERKILKLVLFFGLILFLIGFCIASFVYIKGGIAWLVEFNINHGLETLWSLNATIYSMLSMGFAGGIAFELPMCLYFLIRYNLINFKMNKDNRGITILVLAILFSVITPDGSGITLIGLMLPIYTLIEISVYLGNRNKLQEVKK